MPALTVQQPATSSRLTALAFSTTCNDCKSADPSRSQGGARQRITSSKCQEHEESQGLKLVSSQFRKQCLALWAACSDPLRRKASCKNKHASWKLAVQKGKQNAGLKLGSSQFRKQRLVQKAPCPFCPSGPGSLGSATRSSDHSCAGGKPAASWKHASWKLAVQEGKQNAGLKLGF